MSCVFNVAFCVVEDLVNNVAARQRDSQFQITTLSQDVNYETASLISPCLPLGNSHISFTSLY